MWGFGGSGHPMAFRRLDTLCGGVGIYRVFHPPYLGLVARAGPVPNSHNRRSAKNSALDPEAKWDNPSSKSGVFIRMLLEVVAFRSLFRNTRTKLREGRVSYSLEIFLWIGALAFHYAFFTVLFRHLRFFTEPVPLPVRLLENVDSFFPV
jgi:nitrate reductase gamma subunit